MRFAWFLFIVLCFFVDNAYSQTDTLVINSTKFITAVKTVRNEYGHTDTVMTVYRLEGVLKKYLLNHYLHKRTNDCNNEFTDKGEYYIQGNTIVFIEKYFQKGFDPIPSSRKQIYEVNGNGKLHLIFDKTYY